MMFTELSLGCWLLRHKCLSTYQVSSSTVVFFVSYMHVRTCPLYNVLLEFVVVFQEMNCLYIFKHDIVRRVTELHLSTKFHVCQCCG